MANLTPMYHWPERAEWLALEALASAAYLPGQAGWVGAQAVWPDWVNLREGYGCPRRGGGYSTFLEKLYKFRILGWVESRTRNELGRARRGEDRVEWRLCAGVKVGLYPPDMAESGIRWVEH